MDISHLCTNPFMSMFNVIPPPKDYSGVSNEDLIAELKRSSDFEKFVFPNTWYSKYDLPVKTAMDTREYIKEAPWKAISRNYYTSKSDVPAKPGGLRPVLPAPEVPIVTVIQNTFSDATPTDQTVSCSPEHSSQSS